MVAASFLRETLFLSTKLYLEAQKDVVEAEP